MSAATDGGIDLERLVRRAGWLYVLVVLIAPIGLMIVPARLVDSGAAVVTAHGLAEHATLLRVGMASEVANQLIEIFLVLTFYALFSSAHRPLARQMLVLGLLPIPMVMLNVGTEIVAAALSRRPAWAIDAGAGLVDLSVPVLMRLHAAGITMAEFFWGLWLVPLGVLIRRCGFLPRWLGVAVVLAGVGYTAHATLAVLDADLANRWTVACTALELGELIMVLWLVIVGARPKMTKPS